MTLLLENASSILHQVFRLIYLLLPQLIELSQTFACWISWSFVLFIQLIKIFYYALWECQPWICAFLTELTNIAFLTLAPFLSLIPRTEAITLPVIWLFLGYAYCVFLFNITNSCLCLRYYVAIGARLTVITFVGECADTFSIGFHLCLCVWIALKDADLSRVCVHLLLNVCEAVLEVLTWLQWLDDGSAFK